MKLVRQLAGQPMPPPHRRAGRAPQLENAMEIKQQLKLSQQLVMTPQLQQAIRLLQLSRMELIDEIRKELDGNPVLADDEIDPRARSTGDGITGEAPTEAAGAIAGEERIQRIDDLDRLKHTDTQTRNDEKKAQEIDWEQFIENRSQQQALPTNRGGFDDLDATRFAGRFGDD